VSADASCTDARGATMVQLAQQATVAGTVASRSTVASGRAMTSRCAMAGT
jgi:hypothetical protein